MRAVRCRCVRPKLLLQKRETDSFSAAARIDLLGGPWSVLHHFREQRQQHTDDSPPLGKVLDGSVEKFSLIRRQVFVRGGQSFMGSAERRQDSSGVIAVKQVDCGDV